MINQGALTNENRLDAIQALKAMVDYGRSKGVMVGVETRGVGGNNRGVVGTVMPPPPRARHPARAREWRGARHSAACAHGPADLGMLDDVLA
jgi:hypothetical protein